MAKLNEYPYEIRLSKLMLRSLRHCAAELNAIRKCTSPGIIRCLLYDFLCLSFAAQCAKVKEWHNNKECAQFVYIRPVDEKNGLDKGEKPGF